MATTHRTRPAQTTSGRPYRVALLAAYLAALVGLVAAATLSAAALATALSPGLGGFVVLAGAWLGAVAASPGLARRFVASAAASAGADDVDPSAVNSAPAASTASK